VSFKERIRNLTRPEEVDDFLRENKAAAIFKAGTCHKNQETFASVERHLEARPDLPLGFIRVVDWRSASNHVADLTGIVHESPQFILFKDGKAVFDRDNWDITDEAVALGLESQFARIPAL